MWWGREQRVQGGTPLGCHSPAPWPLSPPSSPLGPAALSCEELTLATEGRLWRRANNPGPPLLRDLCLSQATFFTRCPDNTFQPGWIVPRLSAARHFDSDIIKAGSIQIGVVESLPPTVWTALMFVALLVRLPHLLVAA